MKSPIALTAALLCMICTAAPAAGRPNVVVILADDLGFSDLGCYGSEIATPNLDALAAEGLRFSQFYNTAKCHSSRVSLLTGRWCRQAGDQAMDHAVTLAETLGRAGYFTAMTGKWHLDKEPTDFGFDRYFGHLSGATNYYKGDNTFRLNGQPWKVPPTGFYTTVANVDHALTFLQDARATGKPWFLYVAFNAPHAPLQPLEADYKRYLGRYDRGWDAVRADRVAKQKKLGLFGGELEASPRPEHIPAWDALTAERRAWESRRMAAYAAMIDRVDQEIGRLVNDLRSRGELDNTLICFFSDNGACPYDRRSNSKDEPYDPDSRWSDSTGWAWVRNSPFRYYKQNQFEGGISSPAVIHWPAGLKTAPGSINGSAAHLVDIVPTVAEVCGAEVPMSWPGRTPTPLAGVSLAPILAGGAITARPPIHLLYSSDRGLRDGDWKLVSFQSDAWELYNVRDDRTELHDLASQRPDILDRMVKQWHDMAANVLHVPGKEQAPVSDRKPPHHHREWTDFAADTQPKTDAPDAGKKAKKRAAKSGSRDTGNIRARAGTKLTVEGDELVLSGGNNDPGLSFDHVTGLSTPGPYRITFEVQSGSRGAAELFWTTDAQTKLPSGTRIAFDVKHDQQWQRITLTIDTPKTLYGFRLDPSSAPGVVRIRGLTLQDADGRTALVSWPAARR